ncbi:MAG: hypothetical protein M1828_006603 [Chrysothrix sp. TS-e1954]|nr:MAG: hypothetical protein M1828_006603 [Chrysothrix sp. TS-e1954]
MAADNSPAAIVARYLRQNNHHDTLDAFLREAGLPLATGGSSTPEDWTVEKVLQEKHTYDLSLKFEKVSVDDTSKAWSINAPSLPHFVETLPAASNVLHVSAEDLLVGPSSIAKEILIVATADRRLHALSPANGCEPDTSISFDSSDSPTLSSCLVKRRYLVTTYMSGRLLVYDTEARHTIADRCDHRKYVVQVTAHEDQHGAWIATAAWDARVLIYRLDIDDHESDARISPPRSSVTLGTNPESLTWINHPELSSPVLLLSRRDSTFLYYYALPEGDSYRASEAEHSPELVLLGRQNLAPHANAWISFTPCSMEVSPLDANVVAVVTSAVPHMKLLLVRLLLPPPPQSRPSQGQDGLTQASQARASLALQDREAAAIILECNTLAPQTPYSTPALAWRPDGSGIWVNSDDGVIRGIEVCSGKIVAKLKDGHEAGSKVRCLWAGTVQAREWLVTGGFDRRLIIWKGEDEAQS